MTHILKNPPLHDEIAEQIVVDILRFDPAINTAPYHQTYRVPYKQRMSIFTILREIYETQDPTLAFRNQQCGRGICGTCKFRVGLERKVVKGCRVPVPPGSHLSIEPYDIKKVIRDLVINL